MRKFFYIAQPVLMYILHLLFWIMVILVEKEVNTEGMVTALIVVSAIVLLVAFINIILSVFSVFKDNPNPTKLVFICKVTTIPWYIANLVIWISLVLGFLNPVFFLAIPLVIVLGVIFTYIMMVSSGLYNIAYFIRGLKKQMFPFRSNYIAPLVFHFIFCLDVVGAWILKRQLKKGY